MKFAAETRVRTKKRREELMDFMFDISMVGYIICWMAFDLFLWMLVVIGLADNSFPPGSYVPFSK